jgi:hypothetical protein
MDELVKRARHFATQAHQRLDQRRKYTDQPYEVHLKAVAGIVAEVSEDPEMIAAAWLHDTVEDTPATFQDIELEFGPGVAQLVAEVTDVSRTADGNRAVRKALDRAHLARASRRGQTIKLADLIDNCRDICQHDEHFARVYAIEMAALLEVLGEGDATLYARAQKTLRKCLDRLDLALPTMPARDPDVELRHLPRRPVISNVELQRLFIRAFAAREIAEPLRSFDGRRPAAEIRDRMVDLDLHVVGLRRAGAVTGYALLMDLADGTGADGGRPFRDDQVVSGEAAFSEVVEVLSRHDHCFVSLLDDIAGVVTRADIQKPIVRMWLFGVITMIEMNLTERVREQWPRETWAEHVTESRLARARDLQAERERRGQPCALLDCLQLGDKAQILLQDEASLGDLGFQSRREARLVVQELESLRNNLAHAQDIVTHNWPLIMGLMRTLEARIAAAGRAG